MRGYPVPAHDIYSLTFISLIELRVSLTSWLSLFQNLRLRFSKDNGEAFWRPAFHDAALYAACCGEQCI
jgi:hypothetical protein